MPEPPVEPTPWLPRESFLAAPLLAQDWAGWADAWRALDAEVVSVFADGAAATPRLRAGTGPGHARHGSADPGRSSVDINRAAD